MTEKHHSHSKFRFEPRSIKVIDEVIDDCRGLETSTSALGLTMEYTSAIVAAATTNEEADPILRHSEPFRRTNYEPLRILFCSSLFASTASLSHSHPSLRNKSEKSKKWSLIPKTQGW
ncbi:hypothetical protein PVK06_003703 [Gossypium arboreum]|uniref:Uncharacterized protein n=1 Tax=Gossypium arboreum TaxID=29729 RepID=A0ABR0QQZ5_GOSAR|nr:hypothetical protein PVK06_003703 [Gossypium arboreum]